MKVIQVSCLGKYGRWGNQLYQYAFALAYARSIGASLVIPQRWVGREILRGAHEHSCELRPLPLMREESFSIGMCNVDLFGYFQSEMFTRVVTNAFIDENIRFIGSVYDRHKPKSRPKCSVHIRRGDYLTKECVEAGHVTVSDDSYADAFEKFGIQTESISWFGDGIPNRTNSTPDWLADFIMLVESETLFRSNSTFSLWAGLLDRRKTVYSPVIDGKHGTAHCDFVEGNWPKIHRSTADMILA